MPGAAVTTKAWLSPPDNMANSPTPTQEQSEKPSRSPSIVTVLIALALMSLLPAFAYTTALFLRNGQAQLEVVRALTISTVVSMNEAVDREVQSMITTLRVLSTSPSLDSGDLNEFHERTQSALSGSNSFLLLLDDTFQQLLNTRVPYGTYLPKTADLKTPQQALDAGHIIVSDMFMGAIAKRLVFDVLMPRKSSHGQQYVIMLGQNVASLENAFADFKLPDGWHSALIDGANTIAVSTEADVEEGSQFFIPLPKTSSSSGEWRDIELDGTQYQLIVKRSVVTGWTVAAWAPRAVVAQPLFDSMALLLAGGAVIALLTLAVVIWTSGRIARSVRSLSRDAKRLGRGEEFSEKRYPVREFSNISSALVEAARHRQASENEIRFLLRELAHRSKNQLSVIQSMANQTANSADDLPEFLSSFQKRVQGLARSTDLMLSHGSLGVSMTALVNVHLQPFRPEEASRVTISGPTVRLSAEAAQSLGMALHEMATNAAKYGAFACDTACLEVDWSQNGDMLEFNWRETGVEMPAQSTEPKRQGFGTVVIERFLVSTLSTTVDKQLTKDGIVWQFKIPIERLSILVATETEILAE